MQKASITGYFVYDNFEDSPFLIELLEADMNDSLPGNNRRDSISGLIIQNSIKASDLLHSGTLDLSYYHWNDGTDINVLLTINEMSDTTVNISVDVR